MKRVAALLLACLILVLCACSNRDAKKEAAGNKLIARVEQFRKQNGRLPESAAEMGIQEDESGPVFYQKQLATHYIVWYGTGVGESMVYDSGIGHWDEHD